MANSHSLSASESELQRMTSVDGGHSALFSACESGDIKRIERLLFNGANVNGTDDDRPLVAAAGSGHVQCVQLLLQHGAEADISNGTGESAVMAASRGLYMDVVEVLLNAGARLSVDACRHMHRALDNSSSVDWLPLGCIRQLANAFALDQLPLVKLSQAAFELGQLDTAEYLVENESIFVIRKHYSFALLCAVRHNWADMVRRLLNIGVDINSFWNSETALCCACRYGHLNIVQLLLERGADPYLHGSCENDWLPIQIACMKGDVTLIGLLLKHSSSYSMSMSAIVLMNRNHPLHIAYDSGRLDIVTLLSNVETFVDCTDRNGFTVLHKAVKARIIDHVKIFIDRGANLLCVGPSSESVLHMALPDSRAVLRQSPNVPDNSESVAIIRLLVSSGADCNAVDAFGETPLYRACAAGFEEAVKILLEAGSRVHDTTTVRVPLLAACAAGNVRVVDRLLKAGAFVNVTGSQYETGHRARTSPLCVAAMCGHHDVVALLLQHGAISHMYDLAGKTVLDNVIDGAAKSRQEPHVYNNYVRTLEQCFSHGVNVNMYNCWGETPLYRACSMGLDEIIETLLAFGANPLAVSPLGDSPLLVACEENHTTAAELLLTRGINELTAVNCRSPFFTNHSTPLHGAVRNGNQRLIAMLLSHGADVDEPNYLHETALHLAATGSVAECLLMHGAFVNATTVAGETPLYAACQRGCVDVIETLLRYGANPGGQSDKVPLHVACLKDDARIARMLLMSGADANVVFEATTELIPAREEATDRDSDEIPRYGKRARMSSSDAILNDSGVLINVDFSASNADDLMARGSSPLHMACKKCSRTMAETLLLYGANVNSADALGRTPLHCAVECLGKSILRSSEEDAGSSSNSSNSKMQVNSHVVSEILCDFFPTVHSCTFDFEFGRPSLCEGSANRGRRRKNSRFVSGLPSNNADAAPGSIAVADVIEMLINHGANVNLRDRNGKTALHRAVEIVCSDERCSVGFHVIERLLQSGADANVISDRSKHRMYLGSVIDSAPSSFYGKYVPCAKAGLPLVVSRRLSDCCNVENFRVLFADSNAADDETSACRLPLCVAAACGNARIVDVLIRNNADVNLRDATGRTALHYACEIEDADIVKRLLKAGANPNLPTGRDVQLLLDQMLRLPLCIAAERGNREIVKVLLDSQADVRQQDGITERTVLHCLVKFASRFSQKLESSRSCGVACKGSERSCFTNATVSGDESSDSDDVVCIGTTKRAADTVNFNSLTSVDVGRCADIMIQLLDYGADVNAVDAKGQTALYIAVKHSLVDLVRILLDCCGVDPNRTTSGRYPLNMACARGDMTLISLLLEAGANPNFMTPQDDLLGFILEPMAALPLCIAAEKCDLSMARALIKHGADTKATDWNGRNALSYLLGYDADIGQETLSFVNLLVDNGADPHEAGNEDEITPMQTLFYGLADAGVAAIVRSFVSRGVRLDDGRNRAFRLKECIASSCFLQDTMFELFKAGTGRTFLAAGCQSDVGSLRWPFVDYDDDEEDSKPDTRLCFAIVLDGYRPSEDDMESFADVNWSGVPSVEFRDWLAVDRQQPPSLMRQCRTAIRRQMLSKTGHGTILPLIDALPLPNQLTCYVKYEGPLSEVDLRITGGDGQMKKVVKTVRFIRILL